MSDAILDHIKYLSKDLKLMYKRMHQNILDIESCKKILVSKSNDTIDDFKFYSALIDDSVFYHRKSTDIRKAKLSKDIRRMFKLIGIDKYIEEDVFFSSDIIGKGIDFYKKNIIDKEEERQSNVLHYNFIWMNKITLKKFHNWPEQLQSLLYYHKYLIEYLINSSEVDLNFFLKKKNDKQDIDNHLYERINKGILNNYSKKNELILEINSLKTNYDAKISTLKKLISDKDNEIKRLNILLENQNESNNE